MRKRIYIVFLLMGLASMAFSQPVITDNSTTDQQLAAHYFQSGEFDKAAIYYERLYTDEPTDFYYGYYLKSLVQLEDYGGAEKLIKKHIKRNPNKLKLLVDLGVNYEKQEDEGKAKQQYEKALKKLPASQSQVVQLAKAFVQANQTELALETYQKGKKLLKGGYPFAFEIAELHGTMGNYDLMVKEYLVLIDINESYMQTVQNSLNRTMSFEEATPQNDLLRTELLRRIQKQPEKSVFAEMLIWMFMQQKDFNSAFVQVKALDRRMKEDGKRLMSLGRMCTFNGEYDIAIKSYNAVVEKGNENYYYLQAKSQLLNVMNLKVTTGRYTQDEILTLEQEYADAVTEIGFKQGTVPLLRDWARIHALYLQDADSAISILEKTLKIPRVPQKQVGEVKLDLGDYLVMTNDIWEASLYYAQVDKAFKYDQLGERAKFKNAKIYYYTGQFDFARGMLDVLKGSTSKLIANDALDLSLLITDNSTIDTTYTPMLMYARADLLVVQNNFDVAQATLDSINTMYPGHALDDDILMLRYAMAMRFQHYDTAGTFLQEIIDTYGYDLLADDAMFKLADLKQFFLDDADGARELYQNLMLEHPGSLYVVEARKRFRALRGDKLN